MSYTDIQVEKRDSAGLIILDRPTKMNAISKKLMAEVETAITDFNDDADVSGIVITGSAKAFSTGADLSEAVEVVSVKENVAYSGLWRRMTNAIELSPKPVIAAIEGFCVTGGLETAMACDLRIAGRGSRFAITSAKIGSVAGAGGTQRLPRLVGVSRAKEMLFASRYVEAEEALAIGLITTLTETGEALDTALAEVKTYAKQGPLSLMWLKSAVNVGMGLDLGSALDYEAQLSARAFTTADKKEGMTAFLEKRPAVYRGE